MKPEFKIGDKVTFMPYEKALSATVKTIKRGNAGNNKNFFGNTDSRVFYELTGPMVMAVTTGRSIVESELYEPFIKEVN